MRIVELGDYSMVIMKDSEDPPWVSVGDIYRKAQNGGNVIEVITDMDFYSINLIREPGSQISSEAIYTAGRLVLFFSDPVDKRFHLHDKVTLFLRYKH